MKRKKGEWKNLAKESRAVIVRDVQAIMTALTDISVLIHRIERNLQDEYDEKRLAKEWLRSGV